MMTRRCHALVYDSLSQTPDSQVPPVTVPPERRPRIVLVDDHPSVLMAFKRLLQLSCDVVECVSNGQAAIEAAARERPDVIVIDLMMPDMDGLEVCRRVKQVSPHTDVVIVTAFDDDHMRNVALQEGASAFVAKQSGEALEDAIRRVFDGKLDARIGIN